MTGGLAGCEVGGVPPSEPKGDLRPKRKTIFLYNKRIETMCALVLTPLESALKQPNGCRSELDGRESPEITFRSGHMSHSWTSRPLPSSKLSWIRSAGGHLAIGERRRGPRAPRQGRPGSREPSKGDTGDSSRVTPVDKVADASGYADDARIRVRGISGGHQSGLNVVEFVRLGGREPSGPQRRTHAATICWRMLLRWRGLHEGFGCGARKAAIISTR